MRLYPDVLEVRWQIFAEAKKWDACVDIASALVQLVPERADGWIHRSPALSELNRVQEALDNLLTVADKFPEIWTIPYNLACYCSLLGRFDDAKGWF